MTYQRESVVQKYGDANFLAHKIAGNIESQPYFHVGDRVPSYGIIHFGAIGGGQTRQFKPVDRGIDNDIMLRSLYPFTTDASKDEVIFRLFEGAIEFAEWRFTSDSVPFTFPDGAIINPNITLSVTPKSNVSSVMLYWQPVHVISYLKI